MVAYRNHFGQGWKMILVLGLILVILGAVVVSMPSLTAVATLSIIGWVLLLAGVFQLGQVLHEDTRAWVGLGASMSLAVFYAVIGLFVVLYPQGATDLIVSVLSLFFLISGSFKIVLSIQIRPLMYWRWLLFTGILGILIAIYLIAQPVEFKIDFLGYLIGFYLMLHGCCLVFSAAAVRAFG